MVSSGYGGDMHYELREDVYWANMELHSRNLALYTWGNASGIDRKAGVVAIKPSGLAYEKLKPELIPLVALDGKVIDGDLKPSSDTPTHLELYKAFPGIGGIVHTHSPHAVAWAQAVCAIPCLGTTHADHFHGAVPVTQPLTDEEVAGDYEAATGRSIVRAFREAGIDPDAVPAVLCASHDPFAWGPTPEKAVYNAVVLEEIGPDRVDDEGLVARNRPGIKSIARQTLSAQTRSQCLLWSRR